MIMKAHIGDRVVVEARHLGSERRIGIVTGVGREDGSPPYRVHWLSGGHITLFYPGPETHVEPGHGKPAVAT
jgi:hypothetical protein